MFKSFWACIQRNFATIWVGLMWVLALTFLMMYERPVHAMTIQQNQPSCYHFAMLMGGLTQYRDGGIEWPEMKLHLSDALQNAILETDEDSWVKDADDVDLIMRTAEMVWTNPEGPQTTALDAFRTCMMKRA